MRAIRIALVGDRDDAVVAHRAIPKALALASAAIGRAVIGEWCPTDRIADASALTDFDGLWCVPASPYRDVAGALRAIRFARERPIPFLGTCGGFQHAVLEYARDVLGWSDAGHAELEPAPARAVVAPLACSLVEATGRARMAPQSRLALAYGAEHAEEQYHCSYGVNPELAGQLLSGALKAVAWDAAGEVRAIELAGHPFFVATLFQPERRALRSELPPVVAAFVRAAAEAVGRPERLSA